MMAAREAPRFSVSTVRKRTTRRRKQGRQRQANGTTRTARRMGKSITTSARCVGLGVGESGIGQHALIAFARVCEIGMGVGRSGGTDGRTCGDDDGEAQVEDAGGGLAAGAGPEHPRVPQREPHQRQDVQHLLDLLKHHGVLLLRRRRLLPLPLLLLLLVVILPILLLLAPPPLPPLPPRPPLPWRLLLLRGLGLPCCLVLHLYTRHRFRLLPLPPGGRGGGKGGAAGAVDAAGDEHDDGAREEEAEDDAAGRHGQPQVQPLRACVCKRTWG